MASGDKGLEDIQDSMFLFIEAEPVLSSALFLLRGRKIRPAIVTQFR